MSFTFLVSSLRGGLNSFCGTALRCNSLEWNGTPKHRPRGPAKRGWGGAKDAAIAFYVNRAPPASPFAVAFGVVAPCSAPQKPLTPPRPAAGFKIIRLIPTKRLQFIRNRIYRAGNRHRLNEPMLRNCIGDSNMRGAAYRPMETTSNVA